VSADVKIKTIEQVYEAFGRAAETTSAAGPWYGVRHGKDAVAAFFTAFGSAMEIEEFTAASLAANDTDVLSVVRCRARSRSTGKTLAMDLHHYFKFRDGKIVY
jgi:ketosteroid isomerase-like protein